MAKKQQVDVERCLFVIPPMPHNAPLLTTVMRVAFEAAKLGIDLIPVQLDSDQLDVDTLADSAKLIGPILPLVPFTAEQNKQLQSLGVEVEPAIFATDSPLYSVAAALYGASGRAMASRMVSSGHRNLVYLCSDSVLLKNLNQLRYAGVLQGCIFGGCPTPTMLTTEYNSPNLSGELVQLFSKNPGVDGFICHNDFLAMEVIQALRMCGRMVPNDCAVIGVGNAPEGELFNPPLTSVDFNPEVSGRMYAQALGKFLSGEKVEAPDPAEVDKMMTLVARGSA
ncbi:substrate-binding domain-containing protein [Varibaculum prostatecancerukia]|uniref:substrate-binding domain-containing protein n=1 Tax=Varibaculum prostatecancerukia TaxID=2811781 RepID=UPI001C007C28|nr:substrate-binding domain-containing protein [Varibaculum prostatecancerukia]